MLDSDDAMELVLITSKEWLTNASALLPIRGDCSLKTSRKVNYRLVTQISAGGGNPQVLYSSSISNFRDQVSPDGSHVIVTSNESNPPPPELWALDNVAEPLKTVR